MSLRPLATPTTAEVPKPKEIRDDEVPKPKEIRDIIIGDTSSKGRYEGGRLLGKVNLNCLPGSAGCLFLCDLLTYDIWCLALLQLHSHWYCSSCHFSRCCLIILFMLQLIRKGHVVVRKATKAIAKGRKKKNKGSTTKALLGPLANGTKKRQDTTTKTTLESGASGTKKRPATDDSMQKTAMKRLKAGGETQDLESPPSPVPQISAKRDSWLELEAYVHPSASQLSVLSEVDED